MKRYISQLSQYETGDPICHVFESSLSAQLQWVRVGAGEYHAILPGEFPMNKTHCLCSGTAFNINTECVYSLFAQDDYVALKIFDSSGQAVDGFELLSVEIKIYP